jgi:ERF superfamily
MATQTESLATTPPQALTTPAELLQIAVNQNADIDKLTKLMDLQERWERNEARKAFVAAMSEFKAHAIHIAKDRGNSQYGSRYVSLGNLVATVTPFLSQHGLSHRWEIDQNSGIKVTCIITHIAGHSESVAMICPPDKSGAKNPIQEIKSAITYAKVCTFESVTGLASSDANLDDDGNSAGTNGALAEQLEWIENAKDIPELQKLFKQAYQLAGNNKTAQLAVIQAKDKRKRELQ